MKPLATKAELKAEQDKIIKLQTFDLGHDAQNYLILPLYYTLKTLADTEKVA